MGNFINTYQKRTITAITENAKERLKNPLYIFNDKNVTLVDYFNLDIGRSTLDEAAKTNYANLGKHSPFRFNLIKDFFLYGIERISYAIENGENGLEAAEITGEAFVLPNTITPYPGDYFIIKHLQQKYLFWVISSTPDTLENGANIWKLEYRLEKLSSNAIFDLVVNTFEFQVTNVGTQFKSIIKSTEYDLAKVLDETSVALKNAYISLFFRPEVQTFCYKYIEDEYFYDSCLIEFLRKNDILNGSDFGYIHVDHKLSIEHSFTATYMRTFWHAFELREKEALAKVRCNSTTRLIQDPVCIFSTRWEMYFEIDYKSVTVFNNTNMACPLMASNVELFKAADVQRVLEDKLYILGENDKEMWKNIIIKYFAGMPLEAEDLLAFRRITYDPDDIELFFYLPLCIYCIEAYLKQLLSNE